MERTYPLVVLRYFPCRIRAEAFRYMLEDMNVPYTEEVVQMADWESMKPTQAGGPFHILPVLEWGDVQVFQTEGIANFLNAQLVSNSVSSDDDNRALAYSLGLVSAAYTDVINPLGDLSWAPARAPSLAIEDAVPRYVTRSKGFMDGLATLSRGRENTQPTAGDYFAFFALKMLLEVFGEVIWAGQDECLQFYERMRARPGLAQFLARDRGQVAEVFTRSPHEKSVFAQLRPLWK